MSEGFNIRNVFENVKLGNDQKFYQTLNEQIQDIDAAHEMKTLQTFASDMDSCKLTTVKSNKSSAAADLLNSILKRHDKKVKEDKKIGSSDSLDSHEKDEIKE